MRRKDREVEDKEAIYQILQRCQTLRLGIQGQNRPYIVPVSFGAEKDKNTIVVYFHCAPQGMKIDMLAENPYVCIESDITDRTVKTEKGFTTYYESVIGFGICHFLEERNDILHGLEVILDHYGYEQEEIARCQSIDKVLVARIVLDEISGKKNQPKTIIEKEKEIIIQKTTDPETILKIMRECDYAFPKSIINRDHFPIIYAKISTKADFYIAYQKEKGEQQCLGYAAVYANDQNTRIAYITLICVKPEMQGFHVGTKLINQCFQIAEERNMKAIRLEVLTSNNRAISFYEHHGFTFEKYTEDDSLYMIKIL